MAVMIPPRTEAELTQDRQKEITSDVSDNRDHQTTADNSIDVTLQVLQDHQNEGNIVPQDNVEYRVHIITPTLEGTPAQILHSNLLSTMHGTETWVEGAASYD